MVVLTTCAASGIAGCATTEDRDPIEIMLDRQAEYRHRRTAMRVAHQQQRSSPLHIDALWQLVWEPEYPAWQRVDALAQLQEIDEAQLRRQLAVGIMRVPDRQTLEHIMDLAQAHQWREFTVPFVRTWARPFRFTPDMDRREREVIEALHPGKSARQVLAEVFASQDAQATLSQRIAAWDLLNRVDDGSDMLHSMMESGATASHDLAGELAACWSDLHVLPRTGDEVLWLLHLRDDRDASARTWWNEARTIVDRLDDEQRRGLQLRHLPVLLALSDDDPAWHQSRPALIERIESAMTVGLTPGLRTSDVHRAELHDVSQPVRDWGEQLRWADLVVLTVLLDALNDEAMVAALFRQADADHADKRTEYGGAITRDQTGRYHAQMHRPMQSRGDHVFIPPQPMIEELYTGLCHYHFHVQEREHSRHAAPGPGDLAVADRLKFNFVVFTSIDADTLNIDYHQPGGVVVDLGTIRRAKTRVQSSKFRNKGNFSGQAGVHSRAGF